MAPELNSAEQNGPGQNILIEDQRHQKSDYGTSKSYQQYEKPEVPRGGEKAAAVPDEEEVRSSLHSSLSLSMSEKPVNID